MYCQIIGIACGIYLWCLFLIHVTSLAHNSVRNELESKIRALSVILIPVEQIYTYIYIYIYKINYKCYIYIYIINNTMTFIY